MSGVSTSRRRLAVYPDELQLLFASACVAATILPGSSPRAGTPRFPRLSAAA